MEKENQFRRELAEVINRHSKESGNDTPDFILADYLSKCLNTFDEIIQAREQYYGRNLKRTEWELGVKCEHEINTNNTCNKCGEKILNAVG